MSTTSISSPLTVSDTDSDVEILDTDTDSDVEVIETINGSCPCCGYEGELRYINEDSDAESGLPRKRKRRRSGSPKPLPFMDNLLATIEKRRTQPEPAERLSPVERTQDVVKDEPPSFIQKFFSNYPQYEYDPAGETMSQFKQLSQSFNWKRGNRDMEAARQELRTAVTQDFNNIYGKDENDLGTWQSLCRVLQLPDVPDNLEACREVVQSTFVNLVDLVDTSITKKPMRHFGTEQELSAYTRSTEKYFPLERAKAGGFLRFLLRNIFNPGSRREHDGRPLRKRLKNDL